MDPESVSPEDRLPEYKERAFLHRVQDMANYIGPIDMDEIQESYEKSFERLVFENGKKLDFDEFIAQCEDLNTIVMTAHPTFFKSREEAGHLSKLATARAAHRLEGIEELEERVRDIQAKHLYQDPSTDEEGEMLYDALKNTIDPGRLVQTAMINVAKQHYPDKWRRGRYSPFNRAIWQKFDRDGRIIPVNVQLSETIRQRRLGFELLHLPALRALQAQAGFSDPDRKIAEVIKQIEDTISIYQRNEQELDNLDDDNVDMAKLQNIVDGLYADKHKRIIHPQVITEALEFFLEDTATSDELFVSAKIIYDDLQSNGLCFATPTHRVNAEDVHKFLGVERHNLRKGDLTNADTISADSSHFRETEAMIEQAEPIFIGRFTDILARVAEDGKPIHEMMAIRRLAIDTIDSHTHEKVDIAEAHNAMTQRGLRLAAKLHGVSDNTDIGLLHEDAGGIDFAEQIYSKLLDSEPYFAEIMHTIPGTTKTRPRIVLKIGFSDFAKQHSAPGGKPSNEKCLLQTIKAINKAGLADKIDLDIEFAGGEGPGRRVNPLGYQWTLNETVTPSVLAYARKKGIRLKYRETIQGGDGCILLGTPESAAKIMAMQLDHLTKNLTADAEKTLDWKYYKELKDEIIEHHEAARRAYHELYNHPDFALLMNLFKELCQKGGSRKVNRGEPTNDHEAFIDKLIDGFRAIGFNAASIQTGLHLPPIFGQGKAFQENKERTARLVQSELFRERMITPFMIRDLHMMEALRNFIEIFNPDFWLDPAELRKKPELIHSIESEIATRVSRLVYPDGSSENIYPRLKRVVRLIEADLAKFDLVRLEHDFSDVDALIAQNNYKERLADKRALLSEIHKSRLELVKKLFIDLEETDVYSPNHARDSRRQGIQSVMRLDWKGATSLLEEANDNDIPRVIQEYSGAILDLSYCA